MMLFTGILLIASCLLATEAGPVKRSFTLSRRPSPYPLDEVDRLQDDSLAKFEAYLAKQNNTNGCTLETAIKKMEWGDMTDAERTSYINAVLCLQRLPAKAPKSKYPGALSRYDDFVATHESFAIDLHSPPHLFPAHRLYIHQYEKALRDECGYTGYQPYWNWARNADDPIKSPMFNGNATSLGGNGSPTNYSGIPAMSFPKPYDMIPSGGGGGCVTSGPFMNMTISLGPISPIVNNVPKNPQPDGFGSNRRCFRRDINKHASSVLYANYTYALITKSPDINTFQNIMLGATPEQRAVGDWGVHMGGHYTFGGDPGGDFFSSPGDPAFWFHHGMVDRVWWIWQMQDPENRMNAIAGKTAPDDTVSLPPWTADGPVLTRDLNTNIGGWGGKLCYIYV